MSKSVSFAVIFSFLVAFATTRVAFGAQTQQSPVVAEVDGSTISMSQLQHDHVDELGKARSALLHAQSDYYNAAHAALEKEIDDQLLANEAKKENISVKELLDRHVSSKVKDPSEETVKILYLATNTKEPLDSVRPQIVQNVRQLLESRVREEYLQTLRAKQQVKISLLPPREEVVAGDSPVEGPEGAPITIVEFADYQCPYCRQSEPNVDKLRQNFKGKVRYSFRDFPLPMHQYAEKAAEAARCAGDQGQFWPYHDRLFVGDAKLEETDLKALARTMKLDGAKFDSCLDSGSKKASIAADSNEGKRLGINGTPTFFINGYIISGASSYDSLAELVKQQMVAGNNQSSSAEPSAWSGGHESEIASAAARAATVKAGPGLAD